MNLQTFIIVVFACVILTGCASITNDAYAPMTLSFGDGSNGFCLITNPGMSISANIPSTVMVRRSNGHLILNCQTQYGGTAIVMVPSTMGGNIFARGYPANFVIPIK